MPAQHSSLAFTDADTKILDKTTERMKNNDQGKIKPRTKMTDFICPIPSTGTQAIKPPSFSSKKIFNQVLAEKRQPALTETPCLKPKGRGFCTNDEFEVTCLVLKSLFPWQQESQGSGTVLPTQQLPLPKSIRVQLCHPSIREGRQAHSIQSPLENVIFPRAPLV